MDFSKNLAWQMSHPDIELSCNLDYDAASVWLIPALNETARSLPFYIQEVGRTLAGENYYVKRKNLDSFMIGCILSGEMELEYNGAHSVLGKNSVLWIDCQLPHIFQTLKPLNKIDTYFVHFSGEGAEKYTAHLKSVNTSGIIYVPNQDRLLTYFKKIIELYNSPRRTTLTELRACTYLSSMCLELLENIRKEEYRKEPPEYILLLKEYLDYNYKEKITLESLSQQFFISPSYLQKQFKLFYGCSPNEYLMQIRLSQAKVLLRTTHETITNIAYAIGFNNPSYFVNIFNQTEGVTPLKYRKMWKTF